MKGDFSVCLVNVLIFGLFRLKLFELRPKKTQLFIVGEKNFFARDSASLQLQIRFSNVNGIITYIIGLVKTPIYFYL